MSFVPAVEVKLWGSTIGYLHQKENRLIGFRYDEDFLLSGIEISPLKMPLSTKEYMFPRLPEETYHGLPGLVADSLPDRFGNMVLQRFAESQGRTADDLSPLERLCYTGKRGMGALEYAPMIDMPFTGDERIHIDELTKLASDVLSNKTDIHLQSNGHLISQLMECSSSVGGARAKALIAWNEDTNEVRSGQIDAGKGFDYWLLKFGALQNNKDKENSYDDREYTKIEYAYHLMALASGINMSECRLFEENGISHFMTKRFDRIGERGEKVHMQTLCALAHMDFNSPRTYSYEEAFIIMAQMKLPIEDIEQLFRRMVFNNKAKNFDDHTKNISYLMDKKGVWRLSPAYDITYSYSKNGIWTNAHQMLINGKSAGIENADFLQTAKIAGISKNRAEDIITDVTTVVSQWENYASAANLSEFNYKRIDEQINNR